MERGEAPRVARLLPTHRLHDPLRRPAPRPRRAHAQEHHDSAKLGRPARRGAADVASGYVWLGLIVSYLGREDFNFRCDGCGKVGLDERARCRGCRVVFFCSDQCQADRWGVHKAGCRAAQRKRKEERAAKRAAQKAARKAAKCSKAKTKP